MRMFTYCPALLLRVEQVTDWLEFVLGKSDQPPSFMRRDAPPERKRKKKGDRGTPPSSHGRAVKEPRPNPYATVSKGAATGAVDGLRRSLLSSKRSTALRSGQNTSQFVHVAGVSCCPTTSLTELLASLRQTGTD